DVIRDLLGLEKKALSNIANTLVDNTDISPGDWITKGVRFPNGTEFRASYKGQLRTGKVESAALVVNGSRYSSPSAAAMAITKSAVNGWRFWECRFPGKTTWQQIENLRR